MRANKRVAHRSESMPLDDWVQRLSKEELPMFAHTARKIAALSDSAETPISEMTQAILNDGALTARLLRMANTAYYNPSSQPITTVSRAILVLGFNVVKNIALSIKIIDTVLEGVSHQRALAELVRTFHAAFQAKQLLTTTFRDSSSNGSALENLEAEEVFIAAMIHRLGPLTFWCFPYGCDEALDYEYTLHKCPEAAERAVLGFTLHELTATLVSHWHLSDLFNRACSSTAADDRTHPSYIALSLGCQAAEAAEMGWQSKAMESESMQNVLTLASDCAEQPTHALKQTLYRNSQIALHAIETLGIKQAEHLIPLPPFFEAPDKTTSATQSTSHEQVDLRFRILRDLTHLLADDFNLNIVLSTVMEGLYRALPLDRVVFAWINPKGTSLVAKSVLGPHQALLMERFNFILNSPVHNAPPNTLSTQAHLRTPHHRQPYANQPYGNQSQDTLMDFLLNAEQALWIDRKKRHELQHLMTPAIQACIGFHPFFAMPIAVGGQIQGLVYGDRSTSGKAFDPETFQLFQHYCEHIALAFKLLKLH